MEQPENSKSIFRDRRTKRIIIVLVAAVSTLLILLVLQRMHVLKNKWLLLKQRLLKRQMH